MSAQGSGGVACAYCGGRHPTAVEVRACWASAPGAPAAPPAEAAGVKDSAVAVPGLVPPRTAPGGAAVPAGGMAGPEPLGRNALLVGDVAVPTPWDSREVVDVGDCSDLDGTAGRLAERLSAAARARERLVFRVTAPVPIEPLDSEGAEPWSLGARFGFSGDLVRHLLAANSVEAGPGGLRFPLAERAVSLGARPGDGRTGDVVLPGGDPAFCDGGPIQVFDASDLGSSRCRLLHRVSLEHGSLAPFDATRPAGAEPDGAAPLAPDQRRAVTDPRGAVRVIAPAGSGKTRVLTERARHLLAAWRVPPGALCLVAFNVRAAQEMRARTADLPDLEIRTLNSLALAVVNGSPPFLVRGQRRATIDERQAREILGGLVSLPRRSNTDPAAAWLEAFSSVRLGLRDPAEVEEEYGGDVDGLAGVIVRYREALADRRLLDFDEQVYAAVQLLLTDPGARGAAQRACRLLLVDEFQDLTPAHVLLLRLLAGPDAAVFGVGDDDQTIYGYAGASPEWLIDFGRLFPGATECALEVNYRCPPSVVVAADRLLQRNRRRVPKRIVPSHGRGAEAGELDVVLAEGDDDRARVAALVDATVERVASLVAARGVAPGEVAVLARVNAGLVAVQVALVERGIPVLSVLDETWLRRTPVAAALAWLRLALDPDRIRPADLRLALRRPPRGIAPKVVEWASEQGSADGLRRLAGRLVGRDAPKIAALADDLGQLAALTLGGARSGDLLVHVRDELGLDRAMVSLEGARRRLDRSAQTDDLDALVALSRLHPDAATFEEWLRERLRVPAVAEGVVLATVHSVKGREWPHVVVHDASQGVIPHRLASDLEEERRVFHVALTRGTRTVAVVAGARPSPFVAELFRDPAADPPPRPDTKVAVRGRRAITGGGPVAPGGPGGDGAGRSPAQERAAAMLREWRRQLASREKRPAYTVFSDSTLDGIADSLPASAVELRAVKGVGPAKLDRYGEAVLAIVAEACQ